MLRRWRACGLVLLALGGAASAQDTDLSGIWRLGERSEWRGLAPTAEAERVLADFDRAVDDPTMRCVYPGLVRTIDSPAPLEIVHQEHQVIMLFEAFHVVRRIHLQTPPGIDVERLPLSRLGYSAGRWQDGWLVVETTRLENTQMDDDGFPFGGTAAARVLERYRRVGDRLELEITVEDPRHLQRPATRTLSWEAAPGTMIFEYSCDPALETSWQVPANSP